MINFDNAQGNYLIIARTYKWVNTCRCVYQYGKTADVPDLDDALNATI